MRTQFARDMALTACEKGTNPWSNGTARHRCWTNAKTKYADYAYKRPFAWAFIWAQALRRFRQPSSSSTKANCAPFAFR
jgi:hypothetical protein